MMGTAAALWLLAGAVLQDPDPTARFGALIETPDTTALEKAVRERPDDARAALRGLLKRATEARPDSASRRALVLAERLAGAYASVWADSFPLHQVAQFTTWSPAERESKVAADSLRLAGNRALGHSGPEAAIRIWRLSLRRAVALADTAGTAATLGNIGMGFYRAGLLDSAQAYLERSRGLAELAGDQRTALNALGTLGSVTKDRGDFETARDMYERASVLRQRIGDIRGLASDKNNLGALAQRRGALDAAERSYTEALALSRSHALTEPAAVSLVNLGSVASVRGAYDSALARYDEALAIYRQRDDQSGVAFVLHSLGRLASVRGDYPSARMRLIEALEIYRTSGPALEAVAVRRDLSGVEAAMGDLQAARIDLAEAEQLAAHSGAAPRLLADLALTRADLAAAFNDYAGAERQYARAGQFYRKANDAVGHAAAEEGAGFLLLSRGEYARARAVLARAARVAEGAGASRTAARTRLLLADAQEQLGDSLVARGTLTRARDTMRTLGDPVGEAAALGALGDLEASRGAMLAAESLYTLSLTRLGARLAPNISWRVHTALGEMLQRRGALEDAAREFEAAVAEVERVAGTLPLEERRAAYREDKWGVYATLAAAERARGRLGAAFAASERLRARQMLELLARGRVAPTTVLSASLVREEQDLRRHIGDLTARVAVADSGGALRGAELESTSSGADQQLLDQAEARYAEVLREIHEAQPAYAALVSARIAPWQAVAAALDPSDALIEYLVGDSTTVAFVVTRDTLATVGLDIGREVLATKVAFARGAILRRPRARGAAAPWQAALAALFDSLVAPIEAAGLLRRTRRLIIVPHRELHYLPFGALIRRGGGSPAQFLIERYEVTYAPSASVWSSLGERSAEPGHAVKGVLALAPDGARLPGSRAEVEAIQSIYGARATVLLEEAASETGFRAAAPGYDIIHLASFGVLNQHNPLFSFIALRAGGGEDGRLEVHEVFGLPLHARLVVLSACQTALGSGAVGDVPEGDDWVGLMQAFLSAGAGSVLASLWPVEDRPTARLMADFYRRLEGGETEAAALAGAAREALRNSGTADPFYWAGFELVGGR